MSSAHGESPPESSSASSPTSESLQTQFNAGEYEAVLALSKAQIDALDSRFERYRPELFTPLRFRAEALFKLQAYDAAIQAFMHALQVLRMNEGLHSAKQIPIFRRLADVHQSLGHAVQANAYEEAAFAAAERVFDNNSRELLDDCLRLGRWYLKAGYYTSARELLERARQIAEAYLPLEKHGYADSLKGIAATYVGQAFSNFDRKTDAYYAQFTPANKHFDRQVLRERAGPEGTRTTAHSQFKGGEQALQQLVSFWQAEGSQAKTSLIEALILLGDWHVRFQDTRAALQAFREVQTLMSEDAFAQEFAEPKLLFMPVVEPSEDEALQAENRKDGEVRLLVRINNRGAVYRVTRLSSIPDDVSAFRYKAETRRARFRPAIVNDQFQAQRDVPVVHHFRYVDVAHKPWTGMQTSRMQ